MCVLRNESAGLRSTAELKLDSQHTLIFDVWHQPGSHKTITRTQRVCISSWTGLWRAMLFILIVVLQLSLFIAQSKAVGNALQREVTGIVPFDKLQGLRPLKSRVCAAFGFACNEHSIICNEIVEDTLESTDTVVVSVSNARQLYELQGGDVALGFVSKYSMRDVQYTVLPYLQSFIDGVSRKRSATKLILLVEGDAMDLKRVEELEQRFMELVASSPNDDAISVVDIQLVQLPTTSGPERESEIAKARAAVNQSLKETRGMRSGRFGAKIAKSKVDRGADGDLAALVCSQCEVPLVCAVQTAVGEAVRAGNLSDTSSLVLNLGETLTATAKVHHPDSEWWRRFGTTEAAKVAAQRTRLSIISILAPVHSLLSEALTSEAKLAFTAELESISIDGALPRNLRSAAERSAESLQAKLAALKKGFVSLSLLRVEGGLLSSLLADSRPRWIPASASVSASTQASAEAAFDAQALAVSFRSWLSQVCRDRVDQLTMDDAYNPHVRGLPFPHTSLTLNYITNPTSWLRRDDEL